MITESFKRIITSNLKGKYTSIEDFDIILKGNTSGNMSIYYKYKPEYLFTIYLNSKGVTSIKFSPGEILKSDVYESTTNPPSQPYGLGLPTKKPSVEINLNDTDYLSNKISDWVYNIESEMEITPESRILKEHEEKIRNIEDELNELFKGQEDSTFSYDEIIDLKDRLDNLEQDFKNKIEEYDEKHETLDNLISELNKEITSLKMQSNVLTKQSWLRSFTAKMYTFMQKHPKLTALIGASIYTSLPEELKEGLPDGYVNILLPNVEKIESSEEQKVKQE